MIEFVMPMLGADMTTGTLVAWHKQPGDTVRRGDIVADIETDKGIIGIEVFSDGVIDTLLVRPGDKVPVGVALARIRTDKEPAVTAGQAASVTQPAVQVRSPLPTKAPPIAEPVDRSARLRISPSARVLAQRLGIDPGFVRGTGRDGAVTREDIERAATAMAGPKVATEADRVARMRRMISTAMARSKREIPHYYLSTSIDMHRSMNWLAEQNCNRPVPERLLAGVLLLKAVALALREVPELNGLWKGDRAVTSESIHVGVAISLRQGGLVAPAIHNTDQLSLEELMAKFRNLVSRARAGSLRGSELSDPTITVTSMGEQGVETVFPIIYPPQVAIVGFGKIADRPWVADSQVVARPVVTATLSADHRVSDGHRGALFLAAVDRRLQEPGKL